MTSNSRRPPSLFTRSPDSLGLGVASGLADFIGVERRIAQAGFLLMALGSGIGIAVYGFAYAYSKSPDESHEQHPITRAHNAGFLIISVGVMLLGIQLFADNVGRLLSLQGVTLAVVITVVVLTLVFSPWLLRLISALNEERADRIRSEERADISAHLHDSVLNTLALIQRAETNPEVITLARRQERELRAWMQGRSTDRATNLAAAIDEIATDIEAHYAITLDAVVVGGDIAMDERVAAFVSALREACVNAARHSGVGSASVYVEVEPDAFVGYVRDLGKGFDRNAVQNDRRGIAESIEGRMRRVGGTASVRSKPGEGTEVEIRLPKGEQ